MAGEVGIYIIDACCIIGLENAHTGQSQQSIYPAVEQRKIWDGLQALAEAGQLKTVNEVVREISARTQGGAERLKALPKRGFKESAPSWRNTKVWSMNSPNGGLTVSQSSTPVTLG